MVIYCYDSLCQLTGIIDSFSHMSFVRSYVDCGDWEILIDGQNTEYVEVLKASTYIRINHYMCGVILSIQKSLDQTKHEYTVSGKELKYLANRRITIPAAGADSIVYEDKSPEYIMADLLTTQLINPTNANRKITSTLAAYTEGSESITYDEVYKNLFDEVRAIAQGSKVGWYASVNNQGIVWHLYRGINRTLNQYDNEPLLMDTRLDTIDSLSYTKTLTQENTAFVAGEGEGAERTTYILNDTNTGINRHEIYVDARNEEDSTLLPDKGQEALDEYGTSDIVTTKLAYNKAKEIGQNFDLGDTGTIVSEGLDLDLTQIEYVWENNNEQITLTFGYDNSTITSALKRYTLNYEVIVDTNI